MGRLTAWLAGLLFPEPRAEEYQGDAFRTDTASQAGYEVGHRLLGTCRSVLEVLEAQGLDEGLEDDAEFCAALDDTAFCCEECGWWSEPHECGEDGRCEDCREYDDEG
jgi:hypothetical protein